MILVTSIITEKWRWFYLLPTIFLWREPANLIDKHDSGQWSKVLKGKKRGSSGRYPIIHFQFQLRVSWLIAVESEQISWIIKICVSSLQNNEGIYIYTPGVQNNEGICQKTIHRFPRVLKRVDDDIDRRIQEYRVTWVCFFSRIP